MPHQVSVRKLSQTPTLDYESAQVFLRQGQLIIAKGEVARFAATGENRIEELSKHWQGFLAQVEIASEVAAAGAGLIALTSITFSANSDSEALLIIPKTTTVIRDSESFVVEIDLPEIPSQRTEIPSGSFVPGTLSANGFKELVSNAIARIDNSELEKVVLSRDLILPISARPNLGPAVTKLHARYPHCWTYAIGDVFGASPELLLRAEAGEVSARVLAGTAARGTDPDVDRAIAEALSHSQKNLHEHRLAAQSMIERLEPFCEVVEADQEPFSLALPDLWHLATDVRGKLKAQVTLLDVIAELHPTAAVAGTPRRKAQALIEQLEPYDRAGYAGPVGWLSSDGSGELAIALRGGVIEANQIRAFAGCGIVVESDPEAELEETELKFRAVRHAFS